jgi:tRNA modification GTPase
MFGSAKVAHRGVKPLLQEIRAGYATGFDLRGGLPGVASRRMPRFTETIAALATPAGTAAIAVLRVSGPDAALLAQQIFGITPPPRQAFHADYRDRAGQLLDDVLATYFQAPHSYTGEDALEVSSHGNPFIAQKILEDLLARGCRLAEAGEFTQRAFLNGRMDLSQAEAVMDLIHARSERALAAANQQLRGALGRRLESLTSGLLAVLARIEAYIDFPDEDLPQEDRSIVKKELERIVGETDRLLATSHYGELLREGIKTVIIGAPNAGKSSLLNRLVGHERALVSAEPGTTRDFIEERLIVGPHCLRLIDTAGLNPSPAPLEKMGMAKTLERAAAADLFLWVLDATQPRPVISEEFQAAMSGKPVISVLNKIDQPTHSSYNIDEQEDKSIRLSALTGEGMDELSRTITRCADSFQSSVGEDLIAINTRHAHALAKARECLQAARANLTQNGPVELLASDLRGAVDALGEIAGRIDNERMLDELFATFCIGK